MSLPTATSGLFLPLTCSICGFFIIGAQDASRLSANLEQHGVSCDVAGQWVSEYRAFHSRPPFISGVGHNSGPGAADGHPPRDYCKRFDDNDQFQDDISFVVRSFGRPSGPRLSGVGYPIHEACWELLRQHAKCQGEENLSSSSYAKFLLLLHHSTLNGLGNDWAGDFGGLEDSNGRMKIPAIPNAMFDPFNIHSVSVLVKQAIAKTMNPMTEKPVFGRGRNRGSPAVVSQVCTFKPGLQTLPREIIVMVVEQLSIQDLLNLWIASPSIPDYFPQSFWRSRFRDGMEFGHLFEFKRLWNLQYVHWYTLFWMMKQLSSSDSAPAIHNRRRILTVAGHVTELALKYADVQINGQEVALGRPILLETDGFLAHQLVLSLPAPREITSIGISTVYLPDRRYLSGLKINDVFKLGYCHEEASETLQIDTSQKGFIECIGCYMDRMGLRGLYVVTDRGWKIGTLLETGVGQVSQGLLPLGERLIGRFDATKFTALGIDKPFQKPRDSRNDLLWWQNLPPADIIVDTERHFYHEIRAAYHSPWDIRYNPVQYHIFDSTESLLGITAYVKYLNVNLVGLEFIYQSCHPSHPERKVFFGQNAGTPIHFPIDGPGGEHIVGCRVSKASAWILAPVLSLTTNRGRSSWFCTKPRDGMKDLLIESHYIVCSDEYIAGLMWASGGCGNKLDTFWNFGILSRRVLSSLPEA